MLARPRWALCAVPQKSARNRQSSKPWALTPPPWALRECQVPWTGEESRESGGEQCRESQVPSSSIHPDVRIPRGPGGAENKAVKTVDRIPAFLKPPLQRTGGVSHAVTAEAAHPAAEHGLGVETAATGVGCPGPG